MLTPSLWLRGVKRVKAQNGGAQQTMSMKWTDPTSETQPSVVPAHGFLWLAGTPLLL